MKKNILFGILMLFAQILSAQNDTVAVFSKKNALSLGLNMSGFLHYDRIVWQKGKHKLGFGIGGWLINSTRNSSLYGEEDKSWSFLGSTSFNYLYGSNKRMLELNIIYTGGYWTERRGAYAFGRNDGNGGYRAGSSGASFFNDPELRKLWENKTDFLIDSTYLSGQQDHVLTARIGYRRQNPKGGFFFKTGITFMGVHLNDRKGFPDLSVLVTGNGYKSRTFDIFFFPDVSFGWSF